MSATNSLSGLHGIRIAHVTSVPFFLVTQLGGQMRFLHDHGMIVTMVTSPGPELMQFTFGPGFNHIVADIRRKPAPLRDILTLLHLIRIFRSQRFDIVHSTTPKAGLLTALAGFLARIPLRLHTFTGQQWTTMSGAIRLVSRLSDRLIGLLNSRCYADSRSQRDFLVSEGIIRADRISVLGDGSLAGVDLVRFNPELWPKNRRVSQRQEFGVGHNSVVLAFIGRIARDKGIQELLAAFNRLRQTGYDCHIFLVGPSDADCGGQSFLIDSAPYAADRIHAVGYTDQPERYLAIADLLCLPSYREGFGTVVIEAAAMGVATVGTRINGLTDAVVHGETGVLVPPRDADALYAALASLLDAPEQIARLGAAARDRARHLFDAQRVSRLVAEEYLRLLRDEGQNKTGYRSTSSAEDARSGRSGTER